MKSLNAALGDIIRRQRKHAELSQTELAQRIGLKQGALSKLERGATPWNVEKLALVAHELGVTPSMLVSIAEDEARANEPPTGS